MQHIVAESRQMCNILYWNRKLADVQHTVVEQTVGRYATYLHADIRCTAGLQKIPAPP